MDCEMTKKDERLSPKKIPTFVLSHTFSSDVATSVYIF